VKLPCFIAEVGGLFLSTVDDLPSIIFITLPYVEGLTKIGRGYSHYSFAYIPKIGAYFHL
jgi:hypothetical protein